MVLLSHTALVCNESKVNYEIFRTGDVLLFKPFFYHLDENFPCIVVAKDDNGWKLQEHFDHLLEEQVMEDIALLKIR